MFLLGQALMAQDWECWETHEGSEVLRGAGAEERGSGSGRLGAGTFYAKISMGTSSPGASHQTEQHRWLSDCVHRKKTLHSSLAAFPLAGTIWDLCPAIVAHRTARTLFRMNWYLKSSAADGQRHVCPGPAPLTQALYTGAARASRGSKKELCSASDRLGHC